MAKIDLTPVQSSLIRLAVRERDRIKALADASLKDELDKILAEHDSKPPNEVSARVDVDNTGKPVSISWDDPKQPETQHLHPKEPEKVTA